MNLWNYTTCRSVLVVLCLFSTHLAFSQNGKSNKDDVAGADGAKTQIAADTNSTIRPLADASTASEFGGSIPGHVPDARAQDRFLLSDERLTSLFLRFNWKPRNWRPDTELAYSPIPALLAKNLFRVDISGHPKSKRTSFPILFQPQAIGSAPPVSPPKSPRLAPRRIGGRVGLIFAGLGLIGGGTALLVNGKNQPNSSYNPAACRNELATSGSQFAGVIGGSNCRETNVSGMKIAGVVTMAVGASFTLWGLLK